MFKNPKPLNPEDFFKLQVFNVVSDCWAPQRPQKSTYKKANHFLTFTYTESDLWSQHSVDLTVKDIWYETGNMNITSTHMGWTSMQEKKKKQQKVILGAKIYRYLCSQAADRKLKELIINSARRSLYSSLACKNLISAYLRITHHCSMKCFFYWNRKENCVFFPQYTVNSAASISHSQSKYKIKMHPVDFPNTRPWPYHELFIRKKNIFHQYLITFSTFETTFFSSWWM